MLDTSRSSKGMDVGEDLIAMETWDANVVRWTSLGLVKLADTAASVPLWEYFAVALALVTIWLYIVLDFHLVDDLLHGLRGELPRIHHSFSSKVAAYVLPKCEILKKRYRATPWLSSPHLQTAFLHFNGYPPPIKYHRQLYITPDKGTIALDWVIPPSCEDLHDSALNQQIPELDETPVVLIIPGLTSDSKDPYLKHIAYSSATKGWRTLVANHRGLGGVSITSDQFYNAGWTEDVRRIVNYIHNKYPKAPLFTIGTSIGANILVKYLGEEGASTPVGAAAAVCCPWDLLVCDRFMSRRRVQKLYNKVLAFGLLQYAASHQAVLARIANWDDVSKSKTIRDFDHHCTRHTGNYETVDTYYRRCSSADFLDKVAIPLICFNALDDPVCTKEAIPWDEVKANPNVVMITTKHGGHLAYFEGFRARHIWWARVLIEYMTVVLPSTFMHTPNKVVGHFSLVHKVSGPSLKTSGPSDIDSAPYLNVSSSGQVAAEDMQPSSPENTDQEDTVDERDVVYEREVVVEEDEVKNEHVIASREIGSEEEDDSTREGVVTLTFKDTSEVAALQSALSQLLQQLDDWPLDAKICRNKHREIEDIPKMTAAAAEAMTAQLKESTILALQNSSRRALKVPVTSLVMSQLSTCREVATSLASSRIHTGGLSSLEVPKSNWSKNESEDVSHKCKNELLQKPQTQRGGANNANKGLAVVAAQNRKTLWLLTYIALVTTCPLIGSALLFRWRGQITAFTKRLLK